MKKLNLILMGVLAGGLFATTAQAAPYMLEGGPIVFDFNNREQISVVNGIDDQSGGTEASWLAAYRSQTTPSP